MIIGWIIMNQETSEGNLMQVLTGILEDSVQTLKRIEKAVNESTSVAKIMLEKIDLIDKKVESGFVAVVKNAIPSLETKFLEKIKSVGGEMGDLTTILPEIITKLQQSMQILTIQDLIKQLDAAPADKKKSKPAVEEDAGSPQEEIQKIAKTNDKKSPPPPEAPPSPEPEKPKEKGSEADHLLKPSSFFGS